MSRVRTATDYRIRWLLSITIGIEKHSEFVRLRWLISL